MAANHVIPMLLQAMKEQVTKRLQTEIPNDDVTRADIVKLGLLFDNKTRHNIQIGITGGDHDVPEELDGIASLNRLPEISMKYPFREIGGGQTWMRRGTARIECFFIRERLSSEDEAFQKAYEVLGRLCNAIEETPIATLEKDSFGERVLSIHVYASSFFESGGPPTSWIFRGKVHWAAYTEKTSGIQFI